jgi:hypothetical protein
MLPDIRDLAVEMARRHYSLACLTISRLWRKKNTALTNYDLCQALDLNSKFLKKKLFIQGSTNITFQKLAEIHFKHTESQQQTSAAIKEI